MTKAEIADRIKSLTLYEELERLAPFGIDPDTEELYIGEFISLAVAILDAVEPEPLAMPQLEHTHMITVLGIRVKAVTDPSSYNEAITQYRNNRASIGLGKEEK